jgi:hypothetical protein
VYIAAVAAPVTLAVFVLLLLLLAATRAGAVERNFAGSAQLDYFWVPAERASTAPSRTTFDGFTSEVALKLAVDVSMPSANVKVATVATASSCRWATSTTGCSTSSISRRPLQPTGAFNARHDPANHATSSKPLPYDMGRMLRMPDRNLGVIPSPSPTTGSRSAAPTGSATACRWITRATPCPDSKATL